MSKLDVLIRELCSNGVEAIRLKEVLGLQYGQGNNIPITIGDYPVYGSNGIVGNTNEFNSEDSPIIGHIGSAGYVQWGQGKHYVTYNGIIVKCKADKIIPRYAYHLLIKMNLPSKIKGSQPFISYDDVYKIKVQIPPLEVQHEIVRILDNFTELTAELTAELKARKQQYDFYRVKLLTFDENVKYLSLGEVCNLTAGGDVPKGHFSKTMTSEFKIPIYSNGIGDNALYGYTDVAKINKPSVTISARGTIGYSSLHKEPHYPIIRLICAIPKEGVCVDYLYYAIQLIKFQVPTSGIPQLTVPMVAKYKIPVPSLKVQKHIVSILDSFESLVYDIKQGLPAEIALRQKQYEYYRNKLLSFKEKLE